MRPSCALLLLTLLVVYNTSMAAIFDPEGLSCKCRKVTSSFGTSVPSEYASIKIILPGISCRRPEIILTLKSGRSLCVDPEAQWVQTLMTVM
ncbi:growth-regulated alpha protein-like [Sphaerodactylus townsendi]|uniref:growth-regulated alpha protein-like n=1 Tax=Sphaerodactylus townsendi TaxID=933632 RepID=UPI002025D7FB|nr:growth-regulated alpha protein-like [Sphaerodactylus townsendi]